jgi:hypothetical protein
MPYSSSPSQANPDLVLAVYRAVFARIYLDQRQLIENGRGPTPGGAGDLQDRIEAEAKRRAHEALRVAATEITPELLQRLG